MAALVLVCAAGAGAPALIPSASGMTEAGTATTGTAPAETTPAETTPAETTPTETTPTETAPPAETEPERTYPPPLPPDYVPEEDPYAEEQAPPPPPPSSSPRPSSGSSGSTSTSSSSSSSGTPPAPPPERCAHASARVSAAGDGRVLAALRCLVDAERYGYGLNPLSADDRLDRAAAGHAHDMAARGYFGHTAPDPSPNGQLGGDRIATTGYPVAVWGENLAAGQRTARDVVEAWMASPPHRAELLDERFTQMGIGYAIGSDGRVRWAQVFARPVGEGEPVHDRLAGVRAAAARRRLSARAVRKGPRIVVKGRLRGPASMRRRVRVTALRDGRARSRTVRVRLGRPFAFGVAVPGGSGRIRLVLRMVGGDAPPPVRLSV